MKHKPSIKERIKVAFTKLTRVRSILNRRIARVAKCKAQQEIWKRRARRLQKRHHLAKAQAASNKVAFWHDQLDKAILGKKAYEAREARIQKKVELLKKKLPHKEDVPSGSGATVYDAPWNPNKRPIANWLIPWLNKTWEAGCHFTVTSGYRSPAYQCEVCKGVCGNCGGCAGTCAAPGTSNHGRTAFPYGAVDVTNYYEFGATQHRIGSPLHNILGSRDPVHFSYYGN
jgi:hypothetical protein